MQKTKKLTINNLFLSLLKSIENLGSRYPYIGKVYGKLFYEKMLNKEIIKARLKPEMKILHIGCGPLPLTAIALAKKGFQVEAIDYDFSALISAQKLIEKYKLEDKVTFTKNNGLNLKSTNYDVFWISLHVYPKKELIDKLLGELSSNKTIIYRNPRGWLKRLYPYVKLEKSSSYDFKFIKQFFAKESVIIKIK